MWSRLLPWCPPKSLRRSAVLACIISERPAALPSSAAARTAEKLPASGKADAHGSAERLSRLQNSQSRALRARRGEVEGVGDVAHGLQAAIGPTRRHVEHEMIERRRGLDEDARAVATVDGGDPAEAGGVERVRLQNVLPVEDAVAARERVE